MPNYKWEGVDDKKRKINGVIFASNIRDVRFELRNQNIKVIRITRPGILDLDLGEFMVERGMAQPFTQKELSGFTRKLSILINAGVPILESLEIISNQERNPVFKRSQKQITMDVGSGKTLFEALNRQPGFDNLYCNLVKAGEAGGILDEVLDKINEFLEKKEAVKKKVKSALTYPAVVLVVSFIVVGFLLSFVVPQIAESFASTGKELPAITTFVMDLSEGLQKNFLFIVGGILVSVFLFSSFIKSKSGKPLWDRATLDFPVFGELIIKGQLATFTRTLSTMLGSGVPMLDSMDIALDTLDNEKISFDCSRIKKSIANGKTISSPMMRIKYFPEMVSQMVKVGEATGKVDDMLLKVANVFEEEVNDRVDAATKMIEPILIVFLGGIVALILVAMYMPIFSQASG